jgi:hypothetical protein
LGLAIALWVWRSPFGFGDRSLGLASLVGLTVKDTQGGYLILMGFDILGKLPDEVLRFFPCLSIPPRKFNPVKVHRVNNLLVNPSHIIEVLNQLSRKDCRSFFDEGFLCGCSLPLRWFILTRKLVILPRGSNAKKLGKPKTAADYIWEEWGSR